MTGRTRQSGIALFLLVAASSAQPALAANNGKVPVNTPASARRMIADLIGTFGSRYEGGAEYARRLDEIQERLRKNARDGDAQTALQKLIREASLANPLLDFDKVLVIRRTKEANRKLNSHTSETIKRTGWDNEISEISDLRGKVKVRTVYRHPDGSVMKHMDLHFSGKRIMFSAVGRNGNWAVLDVDADGKDLRELTPDDQKSVQWFDGCYLPRDGRILSCSTASMQGLPCENGGRPMVNLYRVDTETKEARQLTFEQDSDWHPQVLNNGRVLYLRWEYTDTPHYFSRYLFHMNPDGTAQMEFWGSGSYFPTAFVWARPVPKHPSMVAGIVSGHHAKSETGRLVLIDPALGRKYPLRVRPKHKTWGKEKSGINLHPDVFPAEVTGCVQEIPGWGRDVVGNVYDNQGGGQKYTFGTPWPLSEKYHLVSMRGFGKGRGWSLCLVDVFDNMTVLHADPKYGLFEPIPLVVRETPPVLADRIVPGRPTTIFCTDIYGGRGLKGIPRGAVRKLRLFAYHFGYVRSGGHESCGLESSWDIKRILGTVPVEEDGSFCFRVPANTPIAMQPLDEEGAALAIMRSWMVGKPGETLSCNGCHENQSTVTPIKVAAAARRGPREIDPWHGPARPFAYPTEVQPTLNRLCLGCHNEKDKKGGLSFEKGNMGSWKKDASYLNLVAFVRRPGPESDLDLFNAMEWHASTSPLVQMLRKGHHGVELDCEAWERFYTWIDLNAPHRGMWNNQKYEKLRLDLAKLYGGMIENPEEEHRRTMAESEKQQVKPVIPARQRRPAPDGLKARGFPFDAERAKQMQAEAGAETMISIGLTTAVAKEVASTPEKDRGESGRVEFSPWHATAELKARDFDEKHFPLEGVDLRAKGPDGKPLWQKRPEWQDDEIHKLRSSDSRSTYLFRTITSERAQSLPVSLGSDDGLELWLNGKTVISMNVSRGVERDQDTAELKLRKGRNELLFKIYNSGGGYGFYFSSKREEQEAGNTNRGDPGILEMALIPAGSFVMGDADGHRDEWARAVVRIEKPFYMSVCEITNAQYAAYDPDHDTRYLDEHGKDHSVPGYIANHADQPVSRVSWREATAFCEWLAKKSGRKVALPTEAQWEWAARAGSGAQFFYGDKDTDFSKWANLADASRRRTYIKYDGGSKLHQRRDYPAHYIFPLRDDRFTDKWFVVDYVKQYEPNAWGLYDVVGNVSEWTRSSYRPYPYREDDGRNDGKLDEKKVARGGSWNDRPKTAGSSVRFAYESYQKVYNVGFRVVVED